MPSPTPAAPPFLTADSLLAHSVAAAGLLAPEEEEQGGSGSPPPPTSPSSSSAARSAAASAAAPSTKASKRKRRSALTEGEHAWFLAAEDGLAAGRTLDSVAAARHARLAAAFASERAAWWTEAWAATAAAPKRRVPADVATAHAAAWPEAAAARVARRLPRLWRPVASVSLTACLDAAAREAGAPRAPRALRGPASLPRLALPRPGAALDLAAGHALPHAAAPPLATDLAARELAAREGGSAVAAGAALAALAAAGLATPARPDPGWALPLTLDDRVPGCRSPILFVDAPLPGGGSAACARRALARAAKRALAATASPASPPPPRAPHYHAWTAPGGVTVIVRTHLRGEAAWPPGGEGSDTSPSPTPLALLVRPEFLGPLPSDAEEPEPASLAAAAAAAALRPGAVVALAHVAPGRLDPPAPPRLLRWTAAPPAGPEALVRPLALVEGVAAALRGVGAGAGRYLWLRAPGADVGALLREVPAGDLVDDSDIVPMPLDAPAAQGGGGAVFDLHAPFGAPPPPVPPPPPAPRAWRPAREHHVPHTWPPAGKRAPAAATPTPRGKRERGARGGHPPPTAWLRHPTGDWDDVGAMDRVEGACSGAAFAAGAGEAL